LSWVLYPETGTSSFFSAQLSRHHLKTKIESRLLKVKFQIKDRTMVNAKSYNSFINIASLQTYRLYLNKIISIITT
jgi:hypothetical protein